MGPRRKLTLAISELKEQQQREKGQGTRDRQPSDSEPIRKTSRPQLNKQCSTDVAEAYRQVSTGILERGQPWGIPMHM